MALTWHRENASVFVARETAVDIDQLARQMARVDDRRAASQFHYEKDRINERSESGNTGREQREAERQALRSRLEEALQPQRPDQPSGGRSGRKRDPGLAR